MQMQRQIKYRGCTAQLVLVTLGALGLGLSLAGEIYWLAAVNAVALVINLVTYPERPATA